MTTDYLHCRKCGFGWLEVIRLAQYEDKPMLLGTQPRARYSIYVFRCPKCATITFPFTEIQNQKPEVLKEFQYLLTELGGTE